MTYEYECTACGRGFEIEQRITDPPLAVCPLVAFTRSYGSGGFVEVACGGPVTRLVASPAFVLKGKGWGKDGYR